MIPGWMILVVLYVVWNFCAYLDKAIFKDRLTIDLIYWFNERIFVIAAWMYVYYKERKRWHNFSWVLKTFICIAVAKTFYLLLIVVGWIKPNDFAALMAFLFMLAMGYIIARWERSQKDY